MYELEAHTRQSPRRQSSGNSPSYRKAGCSSSSTSVIDEHGQQLVRVGCCSCLSRRPATVIFSAAIDVGGIRAAISYAAKSVVL